MEVKSSYSLKCKTWYIRRVIVRFFCDEIKFCCTFFDAIVAIFTILCYNNSNSRIMAAVISDFVQGAKIL